MFKLRFNTGNEAFANDPNGEVARILREVTAAVEIEGRADGACRDNNGNKIGQWSIGR